MAEKQPEYASQEMIDEAVRLIHYRYYELEKRIGDLLTLYRQGIPTDVFPYQPPQMDTDHRIPVWICWWQGFEQAPELVRMCRKNAYTQFNERDFRIIEITFDNLREYMDFPSWIWDKYNAGIITKTQLSDLLRCGLLYYHGGLWMDATYFLTKSFPVENLKDRPLHTLHLAGFEGIHISQGRWTMNFLYTTKGHLFPRFVLNAFYYYYAAYDELFDYFMVDYFARMIYNYSDEVQKVIDELPPEQPAAFLLQSVLNEVYPSEEFERAKETTSIFKLNYYEKELKKQTEDGRSTVYGHLVSATLRQGAFDV
ncbi:MAG: capsular polysaccharide synthesis protein [Lachnospiraceae bacterium]|nr:capsular polysaccharide synthesis protein [Lachnospiraceae bacterium]